MSEPLPDHRRPLQRFDRSVFGRQRLAHAAGAGADVLPSRPRSRPALQQRKLAHDARRAGMHRCLPPVRGDAGTRIRQCRETDILFAYDAAGIESAALQAIARGAYRDKTADDVSGSGYVVHCLEAALWCFLITDTFSAAVLQAANLGQDADTTAAVCGQIAGAYYGESGIPAHWLDRLAMRGEIGRLAEQLHETGRP